VKNAVMIGGGILGMELAYVATEFGWNTTLIVRGSHVGSPMLDADGGRFVTKIMQQRNVNVLFGEEIKSFAGTDGKLSTVHTKHGRKIEADFAAVCIGVRPNLNFLPQEFHSGGKILVNEQLQTRDEMIFAAGDATVVQTETGKLIPCHTWRVSTAQAQVAAHNMCGGKEVWKESILYDLDTFFDQEFSMIGAWDDRNADGNTVHDLSTPQVYRKLVTREGILNGAMLVGDRTGDRRIRKLIADQVNVEGRLERIFL
jgi:NADPH-dependent 2,4-dienoyl-CoA reductase/sulfur reductase-like enzyme